MAILQVTAGHPLAMAQGPAGQPPTMVQGPAGHPLAMAQGPAGHPPTMVQGPAGLPLAMAQGTHPLVHITEEVEENRIQDGKPERIAQLTWNEA
ncbi:proline, histidine and glycine-rich protein 1 [Gorilla gorilla gorilla]|uniref:proline, histidine and glycine-rich protein 1 n=1 Tax=Gorilla gorilla gorilla TaxID=9595 RepID=UPI002445A1AA|nr:proline, histidine and glycine-rich protein 1 [Gorilla gorilla gorilla]